jgi:hypothetical protein
MGVFCVQQWPLSLRFAKDEEATAPVPFFMIEKLFRMLRYTRICVWHTVFQSTWEERGLNPSVGSLSLCCVSGHMSHIFWHRSPLRTHPALAKLSVLRSF